MCIRDRFKSVDKMPEGLKSHIRYPNSLFKVQAEIYARYHMEDIGVFYLNEDQWDIAYEIYGTEQVQMTPNSVSYTHLDVYKRQYQSMVKKLKRLH